MGAGRKTSTYNYDSLGAQQYWEQTQRNLGDAMGGVIFGCSKDTFDECVRDMVFGLPKAHWSYVRNIVPGMPVFLFNYSDRKMHGIFRAQSDGDLEIKPYGWSHLQTQRTRYPAQVKVELYARCPPLPESVFRPILKESYFQDPSDGSSRLCFELRKNEAQNLCRAFDKAGNVQVASTLTRIADPAALGPGGGQPAAAPAKPSRSGASQSNAPWEEDETDSLHSGAEQDGWTTVQKVAPEKAPPNSWAARLAGPSSSGGTLTPGPQGASSSRAADSLTTASSGLSGSGQMGAAAHQTSGKDPVAEPRDTPPPPIGSSSGGASLRPDPMGLASGQFDAPKKKPPVAAPPAPTRGSSAATSMGLGAGSSSSSLMGPPPQRHASPPGQRRGSPTGDEESTELAYLISALDALPAPVAHAIGQHVSRVNDGMAKGRAERRGLAKAVHELQQQLMVIPRLEAEAEALRHSVSSLTSDLMAVRQEVGMVGQHVGLRGGPQAGVNGAPVASEGLAAPQSPGHMLVGPAQQRPIVPGSGHGALPNGQAHQSTPPSDASWGNFPGSAAPPLVRNQLSCRGASQDPQVARCEHGVVACLHHNQAAVSSAWQELYLMGGNDGTNWVENVEIFCPRRGTWVQGKPMPSARGYGAAAAIGQHVYLVGGGNGSSWLKGAMLCKLDQGSAWSEIAPMKEVRGSLAAAALGSKIYAIGGGQPSINLDSCEIFDPEVNAWLPGPLLNAQRFTTAAAVCNGCIYVAGGYNGAAYLRSMERLDPRQGKWQMCAEMSWKRGSHAMAVAHDAVWAVGGWDASSFLDSVEVFEPHMNTWRTLANMHAARAYGAAAAVDGTVYAMWGMKDASHNDMVEQYDPQTNSWQVMTPPDSILQKRAFVASCVIDVV